MPLSEVKTLTYVGDTMKLLLIILSSFFLLTACNDDDILGGSSSTSSTLSGSAATGAPLGLAPLTVTTLDDGELITTITTNIDGTFNLNLDVEQAPFVLTVVDTSVSPARNYRAIVTAESIDESGNVNVTSLSELVAHSVIENYPNSDDDVDTLITKYADNIQKAIQPLLVPYQLDRLSGKELLSLKFKANGIDQFDQLLDEFQVDCSNDNKITISAGCTFSFTSELVQSAMVDMLDPTQETIIVSADDTEESERIAMALNTEVEVTDARGETMTESLVSVATQETGIVLVFGGNGSWGTASDEWAGYNGTLTIYNLSKTTLSPDYNTLFFTSPSLSVTNFYNATAEKLDEQYVLTLPDWFQGLAPQASYTIGFNGRGSIDNVYDLTACNFSGKKCLIVYDESEYSDTSNIADRTWQQFTQNNVATQPQAEVYENEIFVATDPHDSTIAPDIPQQSTGAGLRFRR